MTAMVQRAPRSKLLGVALVAAAACHHSSSNGAPDAALAAPDASTACVNDDGCPTGKVCDLIMELCVQCTVTDTAACTGYTPVCGPSETCVACSAHGQCASNVCLPDGACSDGGDVAYVDPTGTDNASCTQAAPCTSLTSALATARPYVKLTGTTDVGGQAVTIADQNVTLLAGSGAILTRTSAGDILDIDGSSAVAIYDLQISGASGSGAGVALPAGASQQLSLARATVIGNAGGGIVAAGGTVNISQSVIAGNSGGGIALTAAQFDLVNNIVTGNGSAGSLYGGIALSAIPTAGAHAIDFNTIAQNLGAPATDTGIACNNALGALLFDSDIIYGNVVDTGAQLGSAGCSCTYCDVGPGSAAGAHNIDADPQFQDQFLYPAQGKFDLGDTSPCIDAADSKTSVDVDIVGNHRPHGSGYDIGAFEAQDFGCRPSASGDRDPLCR